MPVATVVLAFGECLALGGGVGKQQHVGHVFAPRLRQVDLRQVVIAPAEFDQHALDHELLGLCLVERGVRGKRCEDAVQCGAEGLQGSVAQFLPRGCIANAPVQEFLAEQLTLHGVGAFGLRQCSHGYCERAARAPGIRQGERHV